MATTLEEFVTKLFYEVDTKELDEFKKGSKDALESFAKLGAAITAALGILSYAMLRVNKGILEIDNTAKALGVSYQFWDALSDNLEIAGFKASELSKMLANVSTNLGELQRGGAEATVKDAMTDLGLAVKDIEGKNVEEQFTLIAESIRKLAKENPQKAISAAKDLLQLRGVSAGKLVRFLDEFDGTVDDILQRTAQIDFMTEEAVTGATRFMKQWNDLTLVFIDSIQQNISGMVGGALAPMLEAFLDWVAVNRELIKIHINKWIDTIVRALKWFFSVAKNIYMVVSRLIDFFGGLENVLKLLSITLAALNFAKLLLALKALVTFVKVIGARNALKMGLLALKNPLVILTVLLVALALAIEDLYTWFQGGESVLGKWGERLGILISDGIDPFIASLWGIDVDVWRNHQVKAFEKFQENVLKIFGDLGKNFSDGIEKWKTVFNFFKEVGINAYEFWARFAKRISDTTNSIYMAIKGFADKVAKLKVFGKPIGDILSKGLNAVGMINQRVASGVGATNTLQPSTNVTNQANRSNRVNVQNKITINQTPGQNSQDLAGQVTKTMEQSVKRAVLAADTGVTY